MSRILTLNIGASKATLAEYALGGKRNLTLTAYGSDQLCVCPPVTGTPMMVLPAKPYT